MKIRPGDPYPLGATFDGMGTNFSLFSAGAERVTLCLLDDDGTENQVDLAEETGFCWHGYLDGVAPGQRYGYRVHGPWRPGEGHLFNPAKLLLDPYARAIDGDVEWDDTLFPFHGDGSRNDFDSSRAVPRSVVCGTEFDWRGDRRPRTPMHETIVYELHVKGFTRRFPGIPDEVRGTYAALAEPAVIDYLLGLGVTAVELMPVHRFVHDGHLLERGLRNHWGYNTIGFFAPHADYASEPAGEHRPGREIAEFKQMVRALHEAGLEVILDVVYNHTAEGNHHGPMLSFKGIDNAAYYRLVPEDKRYYFDYTGTGNTLNMRNPHVLQLLMDSLRYWVEEMHVDGFRFDLASALARELHDVERLSSFFDVIQQDPVIRRAKLIAEPWDVGEGGYQVGNFPPLWSEWNGRYRDCVRDYWRGMDQTLGEFAFRLTGSSDLYEETGRRPYASVNFVTAHDGFTLHDLVSYNEKHNDGNGEENRDGEEHNRSWNCGAEGPTGDPEVLELRARQKRNLLTTLFLSEGVPMLLHGDELGRTQRGNNNTFCQDNELSWVDWEDADEELLEFTRRLIRFRREHPVFHRRRWFLGRPIYGSDVHDLGWFRPDGEEMEEEHWGEADARSVAVFLNGRAISPDDRGEPVFDDSFLLLFNAGHERMRFRLPAEGWGRAWEVTLRTGEGRFRERDPDAPVARVPGSVDAGARELVVLRRTDPAGPAA